MKMFVLILPGVISEVAEILRYPSLSRQLGDFAPRDVLQIEILSDELNFFPRNYVPTDETIRTLFGGKIDAKFVDYTIVQL